MPGDPRCAHCRQRNVTQQVGGFFRCMRRECGGFTSVDGEPFRPDACGQCGSSEITWNGDSYDCTRCSRRAYGWFPLEPATRIGTTDIQAAFGLLPGRAIDAPPEVPVPALPRPD